MAKKKKKCPFCGAEVNKENLDRHLLKTHNDLDEAEFEKKGLSMPAGRDSRKRTQKGGSRGARKRQPKKKDRANAVIPIVTVVIVVVIASFAGFVIYRNMNRNGDSDDDDTGVDKPVAVMTTTLGTIRIELDTTNAPATAQNFINLANSGFFDGLVFHRVISDFMIQGGGFTSDGVNKEAAQIPWENTGLLNTRHTISMARSGDANSAADSGTGSSQFFINLVDNPHLDSPSVAFPYVVFGRVVEGNNVVNAIGSLPTGTYYGMQDWPDDPPVISGIVIEN